MKKVFSVHTLIFGLILILCLPACSTGKSSRMTRPDSNLVSSPAAEPFQINFVDLVKETQIHKKDGNRMTFIWWLSQTFWETSLREIGANEETMEDAASFFQPYIILAVVDATLGPFSGFTAIPEETTEKNLAIVLQDGTRYLPMQNHEVDPKLLDLLTAMKQPVARMAGQFGQAMYFFVFSVTDEKGSSLIRESMEGKLDVRLYEESFSFRLPLAALLPPQICPEDGEVLPGNFKYCPWDGKKL